MLGVALVFGVIHAVVDGVCVALLTREGGMAASGGSHAVLYLPGTTWWDLYFLYNAIAFGAQFSIGAWVDRWGLYRAAALGSLGILAAGVIVGHAAPAAAIMLVGLGNALFHVGAGALVMRLSPCRATAAGVFVGPGAIGLAAGIWFPHAYPDFWPMIGLGLLALSAAAALVLGALSTTTRGDGAAGRTRPLPGSDAPLPGPLGLGVRLAVVCLAALLLSIALRSAVGMAVGQIHRDAKDILWCLAIAACAGKMLGGFAADRFGWMVTSVAMLLLSIPLLSVLADDGTAAVAGMLLFQMTMPVTLMAVFRIFPRGPGLAFGLASLALLIGAVPSFLLSDIRPGVHLVLLALLLVSAPALVVGLWPMARSNSGASNRETERS
jgi:FSR family fosmidomycin resistance protein-like MFS transporter